MPLTNDMILRVAHADVAMHMAFPRSVAHWHGAPDGALAAVAGRAAMRSNAAVKVDVSGRSFVSGGAGVWRSIIAPPAQGRTVAW